MSLTNKIGLGSVQWGMHYGVSNVNGQTTREEVASILDLALKNNINFIDTALSYGEAEEVLGSLDIFQFDVISKFMPSLGGLALEYQLELSLQKLNKAYLYGYLAHRPMDLIENPDDWDTLKKLKLDGKIKKIGFSLNRPFEIENLLLKGYIPDLVQVPYNYLDNRFKDVLFDLKQNGCEIHTRSTYLQGLFFMDTSKLSCFFNEVKPIINLLQVNYSNTLSGILLKFVLDLPFIDKVIVGVENTGQLKSALSAIQHSFSLNEESFNISESILMPSNWPL